LKPNERVAQNVRPDNDNLHISLLIEKLILPDAGQIKVIARNTEGDVSSLAKLKVIGKDFYRKSLRCKYVIHCLICF